MRDGSGGGNCGSAKASNAGSCGASWGETSEVESASSRETRLTTLENIRQECSASASAVNAQKNGFMTCQGLHVFTYVGLLTTG